MKDIAVHLNDIYWSYISWNLIFLLLICWRLHTSKKCVAELKCVGNGHLVLIAPSNFIRKWISHFKNFVIIASRGGNVGVIQLINTTNDLMWLLENGTHQPYIVILPTTSFHRWALVSHGQSFSANFSYHESSWSDIFSICFLIALDPLMSMHLKLSTPPVHHKDPTTDVDGICFSCFQTYGGKAGKQW